MSKKKYINDSSSDDDDDSVNNLNFSDNQENNNDLLNISLSSDDNNDTNNNNSVVDIKSTTKSPLKRTRTIDQKYSVEELIMAIRKLDYEKIIEEYVKIPHHSRDELQKIFHDDNFLPSNFFKKEFDDCTRTTFICIMDSFETYSSLILNSAIKNKHYLIILGLFELLMKDSIKEISDRFFNIYNIKLESLLIKLFKNHSIVNYLIKKETIYNKAADSNIDFNNLFRSYKNINEEQFLYLLIKYKNNKEKFKEECLKFYNENGLSICELLHLSNMDKITIDMLTHLVQSFCMKEMYIARNLNLWSKSEITHIYIPYTIISMQQNDVAKLYKLYSRLFKVDLITTISQRLRSPLSSLYQNYLQNIIDILL